MSTVHFDVAMKEHRQIKQVSAFSLIVVCAMCFILVTTITKQVPRYTLYRGIFHGKYRGRKFEYRPSLNCSRLSLSCTSHTL